MRYPLAERLRFIADDPERRAVFRLAQHTVLLTTGALAGTALVGPGQGTFLGLGLAGASSTLTRLVEDLFEARAARKLGSASAAPGGTASPRIPEGEAFRVPGSARPGTADGFERAPGSRGVTLDESSGICWAPARREGPLG